MANTSKQDAREDVPGNAMASAAAVQKVFVTVGQLVYRTDTIMEKAWDKDVQITSIKVTMPGIDRDGYMGIASALVNGEPHVGFHGGTTFAEAFTGLWNRIENGSLQWKKDKYR